MGCRIDVVLTDMKTSLISLHIFIRALGWPGGLPVSSNILKEIILVRWKSLNSGLKIFRKQCCKQMYCYPGFVIRYIGHRQNRFSVIRKGQRIFRMVNGLGFSLRPPATLAPKKKASLSFEARHWLLLSNYGSPRWCLLTIEGFPFLSTWKSVVQCNHFINYLNWAFWIAACTALAASPWIFMLWRQRLPFNLMNQALLALTFCFCKFLISLSLYTIDES